MNEQARQAAAAAGKSLDRCPYCEAKVKDWEEGGREQPNGQRLHQLCRSRAAAARRDKRAKAAGYKSYGQQYRASKVGYHNDEGHEYRAAAEVEHAVEPVVVVIPTKAGTVIATNNPAALMAALRKERNK